MAPKPKTDFKLPSYVIAPADLGRLGRELNELNEALLQLELRKSGKQAKLPQTSRLMDQTVELNQLNLLHKTDREALKGFLEAVKTKAPVLHVSFSTDPSPTFMEKLVSWLRQEVHPLVLVTIGLQPALGVGCVIRSTNKQFDFSLRQDFLSKRDLLRQKLTAQAKNKEAQPA